MDSNFLIAMLPWVLGLLLWLLRYRFYKMGLKGEIIGTVCAFLFFAPFLILLIKFFLIVKK